MIQVVQCAECGGLFIQGHEIDGSVPSIIGHTLAKHPDSLLARMVRTGREQGVPIYLIDEEDG